jgi:preprotein translocase subunit SecG
MVWYYVVLTVHVIVCLFLIMVVLLQSGKSADIAAAFGGQGSQTAFGPRGAATALSKATTWSAVIFMVTTIALSVMALNRRPSSALDKISTPAQSQPAKK